MKRQRQSRRAQWLMAVLLLGSITAGAYYAVGQYEERELTTVVFKNPDGSESQALKLEVAANEEARKLGLMYRKEMPASQGMIFVFPESKPRSMWMKNTYIPLDMVFLDEQYQVTGVLHQVPILNQRPRRSSLPSKYVIELNAGTAKKFGVQVGSQAHFNKPLPEASEGDTPDRY